MRRANLPLDPDAVKKANQSIQKETGGRPLSMSPEDGALRAKWMDSYIEAAGPNSYTSTKESQKVAEPIQKCPLNEDNFVKLQYSYSDGTGVGGASFEVIDLDTKGKIASGILDNEGYFYAAIPISTKRIKYNFFNDPNILTLTIKPVKNEEQSMIVPGWEDRMLKKISDTTDWTWGALKGDYNEDPTLGQIFLNTGLSLIPVVDQVFDVRDISGNLKFLIIDKRYEDKAVWFALIITVIGFIPEAGSLIKGIVKVIIKEAKAGNKIPTTKIIEFINYFGKTNGAKYLKELSTKLPEYGKFAKAKIKEILNAQARLLDKAIDILPERLSIQAKSTKESIEKVLVLVDKNVDEVVNDVKINLDESLKETTDFSKEGSVKSLNERKQVASKPPDIGLPISKDGGQKAIDAKEFAAKNNGASRPGYKGGGKFDNDGRGGSQILPKNDAKGNPITYKEYDVNPYQRGVNRGTERVVIGSDGKSYYTNDHYKTFNLINN